MKIDVYCDGSCMHNGKIECYGGWSSVFYVGKKKYVKYGNLPPPSSNNKGEIYGVLYSIHTLQEKKDWDIHIYSDSQYVVKAINTWRNGWKDRNYENVKNMDLFGPLFKAWDNHGNAKISWIRGHDGNIGNEEADKYASLGMRNIKKELTTDTENVRMLNNLNF